MCIYFFDLTHVRDQGKIRQSFSFMFWKNWRQENCFWDFLTFNDYTIKNIQRLTSPKPWQTELPICPLIMNKVSLTTKWTRERIWSALLWTLLIRLTPPEAPLIIILQFKEILELVKQCMSCKQSATFL